MKVGDKVYCTQTKYNLSSKQVFKKGKYYVISHIEKDNVSIKSEEIDKYGFNNHKFILSNHESLNHHIFYEFDNFFMNKQKERKLKLEKLKNVR